MDYFNPRNFVRGVFGLFIFYPLQMIRRASSSLYETISNVVFGRYFSSSKPSIDFPKSPKVPDRSRSSEIRISIEGTETVPVAEPEAQGQTVSHSHEPHLSTKRPSIESVDNKDEGPPSKIYKPDKNNAAVTSGIKSKDKMSVPLSKQVQKALDRHMNRGKKHDKHKLPEHNLEPLKKVGRPNYFVAFQVNNPEILGAVEEVQQKMLESKIMVKNRKGVLEELPGSVFKDCLIKIQKLHFTLHVMYLKDDEDKAKADTVLEKVWTKYRPHFMENPMTVKIDGMGSFRNTVLFANLQGEDHINRLTELADNLREEFEAVDIYGETRPFKPHMTVAKLSSSNKLYKKNIKSFPKEIWNESHNFGLQKVESLQLLSMIDQPDPQTGYYKCLKEYKF